MGKKKLVILSGILGFLIVVSILKKVVNRQSDIVQEIGFRKLISEDFTPSGVGKLEIYRGNKEKDKVVLTQKDDTWVVESYFKAPGKTEKIEEFIEKIKNMEGEFRAESKNILEDFQIGDKQAIHVVFSKTDAKDAPPLVHILLGKGAGGQNVFVRLKGENKVYTIDTNLNSELGIYGKDSKDSPKAKQWVELAMLEKPKESMKKIEITTPTRNIIFEKNEAPPEKEAKKEEKKEGKEEKDKEPAPPPPKKYVWEVTKGRYENVKKGVIDRLLSSLSKVSATDIVDTSKRKEVGLENPSYRMTITMDDGKKEVILASKESNDAYLTLQTKKNTIYKMSGWAFDNLFKKGKDLFDLKGIDKAEADFQELDIKTPETNLVFVKKKKGADWETKKPAKDIKPLKTALNGLVKALSKWKPDDYTDYLAKAGKLLENAPYSISFKDFKGEKGILKVSKDTIGSNSKARYCTLNGGEAFVMSETDFENLFPDKSGLLDMKITSFIRSSVEMVKIISKKERFSLLKEKGKWSIKTDKGKTQEGDTDKINSFLRYIDITKADDARLSKRKSPKKGADFGIRIKEKDKKEIDLFVHKADNKEQILVQALGSNVEYILGKDKVKFFSPEIKSFLPPPPKKEKEEEKKKTEKK